MTFGPTDPKWPTLLSLAAHEFRSPLTVVGGYIRMLLKDRAGPLTDPQRRLLEEAEKSCARLSGLIAEVSQLSLLEAGTAPFNCSTVDLRAIVADAIATAPALQDRDVTISLVDGDASGSTPFTLRGDAARLTAAFSAVLVALRREIVTSDQLIVHLQTEAGATPALRITIGEAAKVDRMTALPTSELGTFDEWRGGNGLSLATARRIIEWHGGHLRAPAEDGKSSAVVLFSAS